MEGRAQCWGVNYDAMLGGGREEEEEEEVVEEEKGKKRSGMEGNEGFCDSIMITCIMIHFWPAGLSVSEYNSECVSAKVASVLAHWIK